MPSNYTPCKSVAINATNCSASGDNLIIAAPSAGGIMLMQIMFTAAAAVNVTFKNGASIATSGAYVLTAAGSSLTWNYTGCPWVICDPGLGFIINLSGATALTGQAYYLIGN